MKKLILILFICSFGTELIAQPWNFGMKVTPSIAWLKPNKKDIEGDGSNLGFSYGIVGDYNFSDNYAFSTGVEVSYRGGKLAVVDTNQISSSSKFNFQYIEIPLTLKMKTNEIGYLTYFAQFGFSPGVRIKSKGETKVQNTTIEDEDLNDETNPINVSMLVALGGQYSLGGKTYLVAAVTFNNGFINVFDNDELKSVSNYLGLSVGVMF
ncbi:MAG: PorT family protein [Bacteroidia bacterium]|nr:PorT family protein [Bacteroidia bacterium]